VMLFIFGTIRIVRISVRRPHHFYYTHIYTTIDNWILPLDDQKYAPLVGFSYKRTSGCAHTLYTQQLITGSYIPVQTTLSGNSTDVQEMIDKTTAGTLPKCSDPGCTCKTTIHWVTVPLILMILCNPTNTFADTIKLGNSNYQLVAVNNYTYKHFTADLKVNGDWFHYDDLPPARGNNATKMELGVRRP